MVSRNMYKSVNVEICTQICGGYRDLQVVYKRLKVSK